MASEPLVYEPACSAPLCPAPSDPEWHHCLVCQDDKIEHAHVEGRGRNPARAKDKRNIVPLCRKHHNEVDERQGGTQAHFLQELPGKGLTYWRTDIRGNVIFEQVIEPMCSVSDAGEAHPPEEAGRAGTPSVQAGATTRGRITHAREVQVPAPASETEHMPAVLHPGTLTPISWEPPASGLSYERWAEDGKTLGRMGRTWQWWVGDWLIYGEAAYGEKYTQAAAETGIMPDQLMNAVWVARSVPISLRNENLSWSHHRAIAALPAPQQSEYLERAAAEHLSVAELRGAVKQASEPEAVAECTAHRWRCVRCGKEQE